MRFSELTSSHLVVWVPCAADPNPATGVDDTFINTEPQAYLDAIDSIQPAAVIYHLPAGVSPRTREQDFTRQPGRAARLLIGETARRLPTCVYIGPPHPALFACDDPIFVRRVLFYTEFAQDLGVQALGLDSAGDWTGDRINNQERFYSAMRWRGCERVVEPCGGLFSGPHGPSITMASNIIYQDRLRNGIRMPVGGSIVHDNVTRADDPEFFIKHKAHADIGATVAIPHWVCTLHKLTGPTWADVVASST